MTISEMIEALSALKDKHGDVDVTVWQYGGGLEDLCNVIPRYDVDTLTVVLDTSTHESGIRR